MPAVTDEKPTPARRRGRYPKEFRRDAAALVIEWDEAIVVNEISDVHHGHDDTYGSPRMIGELRRRGFCDNHTQVERLMAENGIYAKDGRRKKVRTTIPDLT